MNELVQFHRMVMRIATLLFLFLVVLYVWRWPDYLPSMLMGYLAGVLNFYLQIQALANMADQLKPGRFVFFYLLRFAVIALVLFLSFRFRPFLEPLTAFGMILMIQFLVVFLRFLFKKPLEPHSPLS